jgi:hypothetical protein
MVKRNNIILAVNPSHSNPNEHIFWGNVARHIRDKGWKYVEIATRALPSTENAVTVSLPARLADINRKLRNMSIPENKGYEKWIPSREIHVLEDWEYRRWELDRRLPGVLQGLQRLITFVERTLLLVNPAVVLTTNRIDHSVCLYRKMALHKGITALLVERSPFDSILLEPKGYFAESVIWDLYRQEGNRFSPEIIELGKKEITGMIQNPHGFRPESIQKNKKIHSLKKLKRNIFFLPMDNVLWTGWEQVDHPINPIDNPLYKSPLEAILDLNEKIKRLNGVLVIKKHPGDRYIRKSILPDDVIFMDGELTYFLKYADVVVTFVTKLAFNGAAMKKPVVTLGPNPIAVSGATYHCTSRDNLYEVLEKALHRENLEKKLEPYPAFVGWLSSKLFFQITDNHDITQKGPKEFVDELIKSAGSSVESIEDQTFAQIAAELKEMADYDPARSQLRSPLKKKNVFTQSFDIIRTEGFSKFSEKVFQRLKKIKNRWVYQPLQVYNHDWRITANSLKESGYKNYIDLWTQANFTHSILPPGGCSVEQIQRLKLMKDKYHGEEIFIIDGEVIDTSILSRLKGKKTFGIDAVETNFKQLNWLPTFYTVFQWDYALNNERRINSLNETILFFPQRFYGLLLPRHNIYWFGEMYNEKEKRYREDEFYFNPKKTGAGGYRPSVCAAIQLSSYLGFKKKYLVSKNEIEEVRDD